MEQEKRLDLLKKICLENITLFKIFPKLKKYFLCNKKYIDNNNCTEKEIIEWNEMLRILQISINNSKFDNFIAFMRENKEICFKIAKKVEEIGGFQEKNSYIIISKNKEILDIMMVWGFLSIMKCEDERMGFFTLFGYETFEFMEIVELLEKSRYKRSYDDDEDDKLNSNKMSRNVYFDVIYHNSGYLYEESEAIKTYGKVNNRMLKLMGWGRKGTIILSKTPIPIFKQQIENGVDSFHILDLRDIENSTEEAVEME